MEDETPAVIAERRRPIVVTIAKWAAIGVAALVALLVIAVLGLNTGPGRRFVVDQVGKYELASGMRFQVGRIDGSLYGRMVIRDLRVIDTRGVFAIAPRIDLDWRPFAFLRNHADIRSASAALVTVQRLPVLKPVPSDPDAPLLPDLDIDVGRLKLDRLVLEAPVTGQRRVLALAGTATIADGRAQLKTDATALGGGDRLALTLDAVPEEDRLIVDARLNAPAGGVVATMAGLKAPLVATIGGRGSWSNWTGAARAALGGQPLANLAITGRSGTFTVKGPTRPGLILTGPIERLTAPNLMIDLTTTLDRRRADTRVSLRSDALAVDAAGLIDLARSRFGNFRVGAQLLRPGSIADNLNGRDVRLDLMLDGAFARPFVDYKVDARAIGFGTTVVEGLHAQGRARVNADRILIPIAARARRISGLNAAAGGLLTNVAINGNLAMSGDTILSDDLRIRSDKVNATAVVVADLSTGIYRGALKGRVNDYLVNGVGIINLTTDVELVTVPSGGFGLKGRIAAQTVRIDNASARDFLGGRTVMSARVSFDPQGVARVDDLKLAAPKFRISAGSGFYRPDGRIGFQGAATSDQYGPLRVAVTGTAERPLIRLHASRPNVGVQLTNVEATVRGTGAGYAIVATGGSPYGPFSADIFVRAGAGPLAVDIKRARFAGIDIAGRVVQTAAGPFTGQLAFNGSGITGSARLAAQGKVQAATVSARANGARIPGDTLILIQRAILEAQLVLYPDAPLIVADAQAAGVRQGDFVLTAARAKINYRGGRGTAQLVADGTSGASFHVAANADLSPNLYRVAAQGRVNSINFRLVRPAEIRKVAAGYVLAPVAIGLPQGEVRVAGRYGPRMELQARFRNLDLGLLDGFAAGSGVGGKATGSLDFVQASSGAFPRADLRLSVDNFTRSGVATVSDPVDLAVLGTLRPEGGDLRAIVRRGGGVVGRMQARLEPAGGGAWTSRLANGSLSGGVRYNGPAEVLWSLAGLTGQQLSGPIGIAADFSGRVAQPRLTGVIRANALTYDNDTYGTRIRAIRLNGRFTNDRFELAEFTGRAGEGTVSATGSVGLAADSGFPIDIRATLERAQLARSDALGATVSGTVAVTNNATTGALISGDLRLPEVRYEVIRQGAAEVAELEGVRRKGTTLASAQAAAAAEPPGLFKLDLRIRADNKLFVSGMGLESEWAADLRVTGTSAAPVVVGDVELVRGTYSFASRRFELDGNSRIRFEGGAVTNPSLTIAATSTIESTAVTINIGGRAQNPQISFSSNPQLPQDELLSRILFGNSITELSATQAIQLASALNSLRGSGGGLNPLGKLRSATGIDRLRILGADAATGRSTSVAAGQYISNDIYIEVITDARGFTATQLEIALSKTLSVLSQTGSFGGSSVNFRYSKDY